MNQTETCHAEVKPAASAASAEAALPVDDPRMLQAVQEYQAALEAGQQPDRQEFLARYADIAEALAECLGGLEFVHTAAPQVREVTPARPPADFASASEIQPEGPLGDYRIVREIGRGGMGVVYEAVQISLGRRVALKVLPFAAALDAKQLQRFKNEAQAAAQLHHTNIVPVFGVGVERGVHYYAMQHIEGQTLAAMIRELRQLTGLETVDRTDAAGVVAKLASELVSGRWAPAQRGTKEEQPTGPYAPPPVGRERVAGAERSDAPDRGFDSLSPGHAEDATPQPAAPSSERSTKSRAFFRTVANLGVQAAEALEHAHSLGVVHRDIKPANLLVDSRGILWITDFGLAHCQSQAGLTMTGDLLGTLRYMSPEQALAKRVLVDHRTDIYSLGASLYELLTLEPVFSGHDRQELLGQIAFEEPRPPRRLNKVIPPELETIVLKAVEKNPADRYATAQELADDLQRYLDDKAIRAKRPTPVQRFRKLARRHRGVAWMAVGLLVLVAVGSTVSTLLIAQQLGRAEQAEKLERDGRERAVQARIQAELAEATARKSAAQTKAINDFLLDDLLGQASPYRNPVGANITIRELLDKAAQRIEQNKTIVEQPEVEASIRHVLGDTYNDLALFEEAEPHLARALEIRRRVLGEKDPETLAVRIILASNAFNRGRLGQAENLYRQNLADLREVVGREDEGTLYTMTSLARTLQSQGKLDEAETLFREVYQAGRHAKAENLETIRPGHFLAGALYERGRLDEAESLIKENLEASRRFHGSDDHPEVLIGLMWEPILLQARGKWDEAERKYRELDKIGRRVLGAEHPDTIGNMGNLAVLLHARGNWTEAELLLRETVRLTRKVQPNHPNMAGALYAWGNLLLDKGEFKQAESELREALRIQRQALIKDHYCTGQTLAALGWALTKTGRAKEGEPLLREGLDICRQKLPKKDWFTADTESLLGACLLEQRQYEKAEPLLVNGYKGLVIAAGTPPVTDSWPIRCMLSLHDSPGAPPERIRQALDRVIALYEAWGRPDEAAKWRAKQTAVDDEPTSKAKEKPHAKAPGH